MGWWTWPPVTRPPRFFVCISGAINNNTLWWLLFFPCYHFLDCNIRGEVSLQTRSLCADCLQVSLMSDLVSKAALAQMGRVTASNKKYEKNVYWSWIGTRKLENIFATHLKFRVTYFKTLVCCILHTCSSHLLQARRWGVVAPQSSCPQR